MYIITPHISTSQRPIIDTIFGMGSFRVESEQDVWQLNTEHETYEEQITWLRNRVNFLAERIASHDPEILPYLTTIDVDACNEELNNGQLTLCDITITIRKI